MCAPRPHVISRIAGDSEVVGHEPVLNDLMDMEGVNVCETRSRPESLMLVNRA
jgi:hypothetical protein